MKKIAVILSGCGYLDGSEITEAVSTLVSLSELGAEYVCFAPNEDAPEGSRNMLTESNRIARNKAQDITALAERDFDAVVFPGGFGAALNLSQWGKVGLKTKVHPEVSRIIKEFHRASKPIGAICIAPTLIAKVLGSKGVNVTIGNDKETALEIEKSGAHHVVCTVDDYVSDRDHKILTTPAYMYDDAKPHEVFTGIKRMIRELVEMA